jgi:hypothetical protein
MGLVRIPIDWQFSDNASPEEKRDYVLKEIHFVAARLRPRVLEFDKVHKDAAQNGAISEFKDWCWQYGLLLNLLSELVADARWIDGKNRSVHHWLSVLDPDTDPEHSPLETLRRLRLLREIGIKRTDEKIMRDKPRMLAAMNKLIREFEKNMDQTEQERTFEEEPKHLGQCFSSIALYHIRLRALLPRFVLSLESSNLVCMQQKLKPSITSTIWLQDIKQCLPQ